MEIGETSGFRKQGEEGLPSLLQTVDQVAGFDSIERNDTISDQKSQTSSTFFSPIARETRTTAGHILSHASLENDSDKIQSVSISMPPTPSGHHYSHTPTRVFLNEKSRFCPQPMPNGIPNVHGLRENRYDSFKTWSGKLERQLTMLKGKSMEPRPELKLNAETDTLPVGRYFDALEGPELDRLRQSEKLILPEDKTWPFLLRFPVSAFGICLGVSSQAILWKTLASSPATSFLHVSLIVNLVLWLISIASMFIITIIYALKLTFYFEAVRREYYHPIRVNFFFAPFIALLFLALGIPPSVAKTLPHALWYVLMLPFLCLELKIYGQWMSGGQRRLSKVANPSNHLSVVGNFIGALLGASMGLKEGPIFFYAVGLAHYIVLFVTLYQRLPTNETLPKDLHPVFFLFVAAPCVASMAWAKIQGSFDYGARISYFIGLFLYFSLATRINFFRGIRFSLTWWAYTFPMTAAAIATVRYSNDAVTNLATRSLAIFLSAVSTFTVLGVLVTTLIHAFLFRSLFPNDVSIAISDKPPRPQRKWPFHFRHGSSDNNEIENYLKFVHCNNNDKDVESSEESSSDSSATNK